MFSKLAVKLVIFLCIGFLLALPPSVQSNIKVSNLNDFHFGRYGGQGFLKDNDKICITAEDEYQIIFRGSGRNNAFHLSNGVDVLRYQVKFNHLPKSIGSRRVRPNFPYERQSSWCSQGSNANIQIFLKERDLKAAMPGYYTGKLWIIVSPE